MSAPTGALTPAQYQQLAALVNPDASTVDSEPEPSTPSQPANEKPAPSVAPMSNDGAMVIPPALLAAQATAVAEARPAMPAANKQAGDRAYKPENRSTDSVSEAESGDKANANVATVAGQDGEAVAQTQAMTPAPKAALSGAAGSTGAVLQSNVPSKNNINEVIQQAQFLARKGGGEMKIQLQPEGLGQVSMHVRVDSGQVSIQMLTQNNDAKKMLEHSLSDLKSNLMSHQLELGAIKVDLAKDSARHFDQNDPSRRQAAQQGWDDFRQGQQQRKEFAEVSNPQQRSGPRLRAREFVQPPYMRAQRSGADRRLDLVA
jgi:flagellar hook-length control protein FliK